MAMTDEEKFRFDLTGFLVRPAILTADEVAEIVDQIDRIKHDPESLPAEHRDVPGGPASLLIDHPRVVDVLHEVIADDIRLEGCYCVWRTKGERHGDLHGGGPQPTGRALKSPFSRHRQRKRAADWRPARSVGAVVSLCAGRFVRQRLSLLHRFHPLFEGEQGCGLGGLQVTGRDRCQHSRRGRRLIGRLPDQHAVVLPERVVDVDQTASCFLQ